MWYSWGMNPLTQFKVILVTTVVATVGGSLWLTERSGDAHVQVAPVDLSTHQHQNLEPVIVRGAHTKITLGTTDFNWLAKNIYYEAGVESEAGKIAVAQVTFNRLATGRWGNTVTKVVLAKNQFSWTRDKAKLNEKPTGKLWDDSVAAAKQYLAGDRVYNLDRSTHYHSDYIDTPRWATKHSPVERIGQHIFYSGLP